jgi:NAD(P)-dependent dehydrogenase (short-subunit alcohol dehydrogenase family)
VKSHKPVTLQARRDVFQADSMNYDNIDACMELRGACAARCSPQGARLMAPLALHHRRFQRHRPGAGLALCAGRLAARAGGAAQRRDRAWARRRASRRSAGASTAPTWRTDSIVAAGQACIADQGVPDVVIANAGISVGVDTRDARGHRRAGAHLRRQQRGLAATFHPFIAPMRARGSGALVGIASVAGIRGLPGMAPTCASKAAVDQLLREPARRTAASGIGW